MTRRIIPPLLALCLFLGSAGTGQADPQSTPPPPQKQTPCAESPDHRALDFWVGEWVVRGPKGRQAGTNRIEKSLDGCMLLENWTGAGGGTGKSINFYDPSDKKWKQHWVASAGYLIRYEGGMKDGSMSLQGELIAFDGSSTPSRMKLTPTPDGKVRQLIEQSTDGGKTWTVWFDGMYARAD